MRKYILGITLASLFFMAGCVKEGDVTVRSFDGIRIEEGSGTSARLKLDVGVTNRSGSKIKVTEGEFTICIREKPVIKATVPEEVVIRRKSDETVSIPVSVHIVGGMWALLPLVTELNNAGISIDDFQSLAAGGGLNPEMTAALGKLLNSPNVTIKAGAKVKAGAMKRRFDIGPIPLNQGLRIISVDTAEIK